MALLKLVAFILCMNTFLLMGVNFTSEFENGFGLPGDIFQYILEDKNALNKTVIGMKVNISTPVSYDISQEFANTPESEAAEDVGTTGGVSFLDVPRIFKIIISTLFNVVGAPIILLTSGEIPALVSILIGIPLVILSGLSVLIFFRGGGG